MARVLVVHPRPVEAGERAARLRAQGFDAYPYLVPGSKGFREIRAHPPDVIAIDLMRLPSYGKYMGALLRESKSLREIPIVFIEGDPAKSPGVREVLPDAVIVPWTKLGAAIERAMSPARGPAAPRAPARSVAAKLGIGGESLIALLHAPDGFALDLPEGARVQKKLGEADIVMLFVRSAAALGRELPSMEKMMRPGRRLWVLWPKKTSSTRSDLTMVRIREMARPYGLVDYKVCAVDETWSGMVLGRKRVSRKSMS